MAGLSHYYQYLKSTSDALKDSIDKISVSCFEVRDTSTGYPRIVKVDDARDLCKGHEVNITVPNTDELNSEGPLYGFEVTNNNENGESLFPALFYFDNTDFTISEPHFPLRQNWTCLTSAHSAQCYPHVISGTYANSALPHAKGQSLTIGFGLGAGSSVHPFSFYMGDKVSAEVGFFKLFLFKEKATDLRRILQEEPVFQRTRGHRSAPSQRRLEDMVHRGWGSIILTVVQRKSQPVA